MHALIGYIYIFPVLICLLLFILSFSLFRTLVEIINPIDTIFMFCLHVSQYLSDVIDARRWDLERYFRWAQWKRKERTNDYFIYWNKNRLKSTIKIPFGAGCWMLVPFQFSRCVRMNEYVKWFNHWMNINVYILYALHAPCVWNFEIKFELNRLNWTPILRRFRY